MTKMTPFLMFQGGTAEAALDFYAATLPDSCIDAIERWGVDGPGGTAAAGTVLRATARIAGQPVIASDSPVAHDFDFTPSISFWIDCADEGEIDRLAAALGEGGRVYMPLGDYGFSRRFAWIGDRFGVTWQLNLA